MESHYRQDEMKQWYFTLQHSNLKSDSSFNSREKVRRRKILHLCRVTDVVPGKKISYTWRYDGYEGNSLLTFELFGEGDKTRLKLTHEGLGSFPQNSRDFAKESFAGGWTHIIGKSLPEFLATKRLINQVMKK